MCTSKILTDLCFTKTKNKNRKWFCKSCLQCSSSENVLISNKEDCLSINGMKSVKVEKGIIKFEDYFKQIPVPFKIYADFEIIMFLVVLLTKLFVLMTDLVSQFLFLEVKILLKYCKKVMKKHFNKNLIMSEEEEHLFQQSNSCWICEKLIDHENEKVKDHCHVTGKFRGSAHWSCNLNFQLTKKVPIVFHKLTGYDSHLIFCELNKFDVKINIIPNGF